jgi:uncharacterized Zn finger protein
MISKDKCPQCGTNDTKIISQLDTISFHESIIKCNNCGCVYSFARDCSVVIENTHNNDFIGLSDYQSDGNCDFVK